MDKSLNDAEAVKVNMFNAIETKDRHINTYRNYLKKMLGVIMSHREVF